jgi:hypothetical protein
MLSEPLGQKAFLDGLTMHVITVAQLIEEAIPHLSANKVSCATLVSPHNEGGRKIASSNFADALAGGLLLWAAHFPFDDLSGGIKRVCGHC